MGHLSRWAPLAAPALVATSLLVAAPAHASGSVFDPPRTLATGASDAAISMGPDGDAAVAWTGTAGGVFVARRPAGVVGFGAPEQVAAGPAFGLELVRDVRDELAVGWIDADRSLGSGRVRVALAPAGSRFGPAATSAALDSPADPPEFLGGGQPDQSAGALVDRYSLALAGDGTVAVAFVDVYGRSTLSVKPRDGDFEAAIPLGGRSYTRPVVAADGRGAVTAMWAEQTPGAAAGMDTLYVMERPSGGTFGSTRAISDPAQDAGTLEQPHLTLGPRGEAVAVWSSAKHLAPEAIGLGMPGDTVLAERDAGGGWGPPHRFDTFWNMPGNSQVAFNQAGDAVAAGGGIGFLGTSFRPVGGPFGPVRQDVSAQASDATESTVALDALGVSLQIAGRSRRNSGGPGQPVIGLVRERGAAVSQRFQVTPPGETADGPSVGTDAKGRGIVVWTSPDGGQGRVRYSTYTAAPPAIANLRLARQAFAFTSTRAALLQISVRVRRGGKVRTVAQTAVARPSANTVAFSARMKRFLAKKGTYTVQLRARDRGPRAATLTLRVKRKATPTKTSKKAKAKKRETARR